MTSYPIDYQYDRNEGSMYDGMAATAEEAQAVMSEMLTESEGEPTTSPLPYLSTTEVGSYGKSKADIETWWADEIEAGWVTPIQVSNGWLAEVTFWSAE